MPNLTKILTSALSARLPTIFSTRDFVKAGALISYGPSYTERFGRAADYVDKILHGAKPGDLPVDQPTKFASSISRLPKRWASTFALVGKPGNDRFLTCNGNATIAHGLWRIAVLWPGPLATLRFGWFAACTGASAHCLPRGSGQRIVAGQIDKLEVANRRLQGSSPDVCQCLLGVTSGNGGCNL